MLKEMLKKILCVILIILFTTTISVGASVWIILQMEYQEEKKREERRARGGYEQDLMEQEHLRQSREEFISEENAREIFRLHQAAMKQLAEECKKNDKKEINFTIDRINGMMFYISDYPVRRAIQDDEYDYVVKFMDYVMENNLCDYRDWMFQISLFNLENQEGDQEKEADVRKISLKITLYNGECAEMAFWYSPYEEEDYSGTVHMTTEEGFEKVEKLVRLKPNWYYFYSVTDNPDYWHPEIPLD
ncbi:hypothetical protein VSQ48_01370 [Candidatus Ventrimonas sp. KK005]